MPAVPLKKHIPISRLRNKLDSVFSLMIRQRDAGKPCIDLCGRPGNKQAGHFRRREIMSTRWDYRNVNGQNEYCNCWANDTYVHAQGIDTRWGDGTAAELQRLSRIHKQWEAKHLQALIEAAPNYKKYVKVYDQLRPR
jgi:hypothetical protein